MTAKHWSMNNVFWRVVAGRIGRARGPDAARGPPVGQHWLTSSEVVDGVSWSGQLAGRQAQPERQHFPASVPPFAVGGRHPRPPADGPCRARAGGRGRGGWPREVRGGGRGRDAALPAQTGARRRRSATTARVQRRPTPARRR